MNQLIESGAAAVALGISSYIGGTILENWSNKDDQKSKFNKDMGYTVKMGGVITTTCGVGLLAAGKLLGDAVDGGTSGFVMNY